MQKTRRTTLCCGRIRVARQLSRPIATSYQLPIVMESDDNDDDELDEEVEIVYDYDDDDDELAEEGEIVEEIEQTDISSWITFMG